MKPIVEKLLKSGIIPQHAAMMLEKWGSLEPGASDLVKKSEITTEGFTKFAEDVAEILEKDAEVVMRETRLDNVDLSTIHDVQVVSITPHDLTAFTGPLGQLVVLTGVPLEFQTGATVYDRQLGKNFVIVSATPLYRNDRAYAVELLVEEA